MAISYPLAFPTARGVAGINLSARSTVGLSASPFTGSQEVFAHQGEWFEAEIELPPMKRADAEEWIGFLLALNGREGTFLMGDPVNTSPRGTWAGSPVIVGAHAAGVKTVAMDGFSVGATGKRGDWIQFGTDSSAHLHKVAQDFAADGSGVAAVEIWPRTRNALADNETFVTSSPKGLWRLASNARDWSIGRAQVYGISFSATEAI